MDIAKFFNSKKRELSDQSNNGDEPKKQREGSSTDSDTNADVFTYSLQSPDCVAILINCIKNVEKQIKEIHEMSESTKQSQIKGEEQLKELTNSINFISSKFDEYEKDKKEKEIIIKNLQNNISDMSNQIEELTRKVDRQEQYSRRNCILIHGLAEPKAEITENTDELVIKTLKEEMDEDISLEDIGRSHRLGKPKKSSSKPRPVIIKFTRYNIRNKIFQSKKKLKGKQISITESLTPRRMEKLTKAREEHGFKNVWTADGKILFKDNEDNKIKLYFD